MWLIPDLAAISATSAVVLVPSLGYSTVDTCTARIIAKSSSPIWDSPSSPISTPECEPTSRRSTPETAPISMKSYVRVKNAANVDANALQPHTDSPWLRQPSAARR
jgi:hypothetical protein